MYFFIGSARWKFRKFEVDNVRKLESEKLWEKNIWFSFFFVRIIDFVKRMSRLLYTALNHTMNGMLHRVLSMWLLNLSQRSKCALKTHNYAVHWVIKAFLHFYTQDSNFSNSNSIVQLLTNLKTQNLTFVWNNYRWIVRYATTFILNTSEIFCLLSSMNKHPDPHTLVCYILLFVVLILLLTKTASQFNSIPIVSEPMNLK